MGLFVEALVRDYLSDLKKICNSFHISANVLAQNYGVILCFFLNVSRFFYKKKIWRQNKNRLLQDPRKVLVCST
jgi:hypothetical protein